MSGMLALKGDRCGSLRSHAPDPMEQVRRTYLVAVHTGCNRARDPCIFAGNV